MLYGAAALLVVGTFFSSIGGGEWGSPVSHEAALERVRGAGASIQFVGDISVPFFHTAGRMLSVAGEGVQLYEYATRADAERDLDALSPRADTAGSLNLVWERPPHIYRFRNHVILYAGSNLEVLAALKRAFGGQVAGE
jgi:hypothetical protein